MSSPMNYPFYFRSLLGAGFVVLLSGCAANQLKSDYQGFENAFAESSNHQMLLNLARLHKHHPTYFFQMGQISTTYAWGADIRANVSKNELPLSWNWSGSSGASAVEEPSFQFIPINDDTVARQLLQPLSPEIFYSLYQQGWPVDLLMRLMVERLEIQLPGTEAVQLYVNSPYNGELKYYIAFLQVCDVARYLQKAGFLTLKAQSEFVPLSEDWSQTEAPQLSDIMAAEQQGLTWVKNASGNWQLGRQTLVPVFSLESNHPDFANQSEFLQQSYINPVVAQNMVSILNNGFSVLNSPANPTASNSSSKLILRSFITTMAATAQEAEAFDRILNHSKFAAEIPESQKKPALRLQWDLPPDTLHPPLISLTYQGQKFMVTDPLSDQLDSSASWNRDAFRLIAQLSSQVSVDISKYPLRDVLQFR